jgi:hypothetical protein
MNQNGFHASIEPDASQWTPAPAAPGRSIAPAKQPAAGEPVRPSFDTWQSRVRRYNSDIDPDSERFRAAVLLLAAFDVGQNIDTLSRKTGFNRAFVSKVARRLIDNGVWSGGRTVSDWSATDEASGFAFWNDVGVAEGRLCRRRNESGAIEWAPAGYWNKSYDFTGNGDGLSARYHDPSRPVVEPVMTSEPEARPAPSPSTPEQPRTTPPPGKQPTTLEEIFADVVWIR